MQYSFIELLSFFFIYAICGWMMEVVFAAFKHHKFVNRGFLLGPICPIYGFGVIFVLCLLNPLLSHPVIVFLLSVIITSLIELCVGVGAEYLFHERLWDYTNNRFNIAGYICLELSIVWGIGCLFILYGIQPMLYKVMLRIPVFIHKVFLLIGIICLAVDTIVTVFHALKIDRRMNAIEEISEALASISNQIGEGLSDGALYVMEKTQDFEELQKRYHALVEKKNIVHEHLFHAFDHLREGKYKAAYEKILKERQKNENKRSHH